MQKEIPEKWVLYTRHIVNSPADIGIHASEDEAKLRALAEMPGLKIAGPLEHAYWDMAIQGAAHILEIWLPVHIEEGYQEMDGLKHVGRYRCISAEFRRPIEEIGEAWMELGERAIKSGLRPTNHDREVYRTMDCDNPGNNDIELQLGIE